ncbi:MAG: radical SAM protein [Anaerolineaceae bacterium]|nr:radical SAM protein [Anaerolineaceae bacterium]
MIKEIKVKGILNHVRQPDTWFGLKYNMNLYWGCQHQCIYCDSRSECYQIEDFNNDVLIKVNAVDLLEKALARKRVKGTIGTGSMNDPYMPLEEKTNLTGRALEVIARFHFPVHVITKSSLVLRDMDSLIEINRVYAAVTFTVTTADDELGKKLEPGAPLVSERLRAMKELAQNGILTGVTMMPILPFIEDTLENITAIVEQAHKNGAFYILPAFGMTLRDRQREYYYAKLDKLFPGIREKYERLYGIQYGVSVPNAAVLQSRFKQLCDQYGIQQQMPFYQSDNSRQLELF